jgi:hypothetical protein
MKTTWVYYTMLGLLVEKIVQHTVVSLAFYFNWTAIWSKVVVDARFLMISGAVVACLFGVSLWGMITRRAWAVPLALGLALFDLVGEFVAQGRLDIMLTVSFIVAGMLLMLALSYRRQMETLATGWR